MEIEKSTQFETGEAFERVAPMFLSRRRSGRKRNRANYQDWSEDDELTTLTAFESDSRRSDKKKDDEKAMVIELLDSDEEVSERSTHNVVQSLIHPPAIKYLSKGAIVETQFGMGQILKL